MMPCQTVLWISAIITLIALIIIGFVPIIIPIFAFFGGLVFTFALFSLIVAIIALTLLRSCDNLFNNRKLKKSFICVVIFALALIIAIIIASLILGVLIAVIPPILFGIFVFLIAGLVFSILEAVANFVYTDYCNIEQNTNSNTTNNCR